MDDTTRNNQIKALVALKEYVKYEYHRRINVEIVALTFPNMTVDQIYEHFGLSWETADNDEEQTFLADIRADVQDVHSWLDDPDKITSPVESWMGTLDLENIKAKLRQKALGL